MNDAQINQIVEQDPPVNQKINKNQTVNVKVARTIKTSGNTP